MSWKSLVLPAVILIVILLVVGFFILSFMESKGCDQIVIDTYELHSKIDIPAVDFIACRYDEAEELRISLYRLKVDVGSYVRQQGFVKIDSVGETGFRGFSMLKPAQLPGEGSLYFAEGNRWGRAWRFLVESETKRLWAELAFKPVVEE